MKLFFYTLIEKREKCGYCGYRNCKQLKINKIMVSDKNMDRKIQNLRLPRESSIEKKLIRIMQRKNGVAIKQTGQRSMPDRLCLWPEGNTWFVETKKPGKKPDPLQLATHAALRKLGFKVSVIWNDQQLKQFENEISAL